MKSKMKVISVLEKSLHSGKHREPNNKNDSESEIGGRECRMDLLKWNHPHGSWQRHIAQEESIHR